MNCSVCDDCGWVCENHPERPWQGAHACPRGGAGMPCPRCNLSDADIPPRLPRWLGLSVFALAKTGRLSPMPKKNPALTALTDKLEALQQSFASAQRTPAPLQPLEPAKQKRVAP